VTLTVRQGFVNYAKQWQHFPLPGAGTTAYDSCSQATIMTIWDI
jgi:hypothetical protein